MFDAQTIQAKDTTPTVLLSPWFPRGGDYGLFTLEVAQMSSSSNTLSLSVQMVHKNTSDAGEGDPVGSPFAIDGSEWPGRLTADITAGFKELVRYEFTLELSSGTAVNWATFRMLAPAWYDKV